MEAIDRLMRDNGEFEDRTERPREDHTDDRTGSAAHKHIDARAHSSERHIDDEGYPRDHHIDDWTEHQRADDLDDGFIEPLLHLHLKPPDGLLQALHDSSGLESVDSETLYRTLDFLSSALLDRRDSVTVATYYTALLPDLIARWWALPVRSDNAAAIAASFGRILPLAPLLETVMLAMLQYFQFFDILREVVSGSGWPFELTWIKLADKDCYEWLLALYRLLRICREDIAKSIPLTQLGHLLSSQDSCIRLLSAKVLAYCLNMSDFDQDSLLANCHLPDSVAVEYEGSKYVDLKFLEVIEEYRVEHLIGKFNLTAFSKQDIKMVSRFALGLSEHVANIHGVLWPLDRSLLRTDLTGIVATQSAVSNLQLLARALAVNRPLLVTGESGSGKSTFIRAITDVIHYGKKLVRLHLGDQTDAKSLIGTYVSAKKPGVIEWQPGVLIRAMTEGRMVLIEDIDKTPDEVLGVLLPLLKHGAIYSGTKNEYIRPSKGFKLIATMQCALKEPSHDSHCMEFVGIHRWHKIQLLSPSKDELRTILREKNPCLLKLVDPIIQAFFETRSLLSDYSSQPRGEMIKVRQITTRDLMKSCSRINDSLLRLGLTSLGQSIPTNIYFDILGDVIDCFAAFLPTFDLLMSASKIIGREFQIAADTVEGRLTTYTPIIVDMGHMIKVGRAEIHKISDINTFPPLHFALTKQVVRILESIAVAVNHNEPILLVGETGVGKTTIIQYLSSICNQRLLVMNMSQQTEIGDLIGGNKPINIQDLARNLYLSVNRAFEATFSIKKNRIFVQAMEKAYTAKHWPRLLALSKEARKLANDEDKIKRAVTDGNTKRRKPTPGEDDRVIMWHTVETDTYMLQQHTKRKTKTFAFHFVEGALVTAIKQGYWVLLDEINLAAADTLEHIASLLRDDPHIVLTEKGEIDPIYPHHNFRLFGCMNPANDVSKLDLPPSLRQNFTEIYIQPPENDFSDLMVIVSQYLSPVAAGQQRLIAAIAKLYCEIQKLTSSFCLLDGAGKRPHYSIRSLSRAISFAIKTYPSFGLRRALYEGLCMAFTTQLDNDGQKMLSSLIEKAILYDLQRLAPSLSQQVKQGPNENQKNVYFGPYAIVTGDHLCTVNEDYIITPFVEKNLMNVVRTVMDGRLPVLLQGPTSSGKTSMIQYIAQRTGHKFVRINNHEHTDIQEYLGQYISEEGGSLVYRQGILAEAVQKGYWIVLDELNLAPSDVLESLNRLLDDNRELFIPETQKVLKPHPNFMLFATQNPVGLYGGRKMLSRALRTRFMELYFQDIPENELDTILYCRCRIAPSYAKKIVTVYKELAVQRSSDRIFDHRNSFATLRDLFRWGKREATSYQQLAENGYMLLGERARTDGDKCVVRKVIETVMHVHIDPSSLYSPLTIPDVVSHFSHLVPEDIVWTSGMKRLFILVYQSIIHNEPVLLIGETGCGKTTVCQLVAKVLQRPIKILNAHQNTDTADIVGSQRPMRDKKLRYAEVLRKAKQFLTNHNVELDCDELNIQGLDKAFAKISINLPSNEVDTKKTLDNLRKDIDDLHKLFEWRDGPLIESMRQGAFFLLDEISLAGDAVLERFNSVLEEQRNLTLAERPGYVETVTAAPGFQFLATMNPGGDYGKKELSAALRNRFTEIWVPSLISERDIHEIAYHRMSKQLQPAVNLIVEYATWFTKHFCTSLEEPVLSVRDIITWIDFANTALKTIPPLQAIYDGALTVYIDAIGAGQYGAGYDIVMIRKERQKCESFLNKRVAQLGGHTPIYQEKILSKIDHSEIYFGPYRLNCCKDLGSKFVFGTETTSMNAMRVVRAMTLTKPILLEGDPGVGKTTLIEALAETTGSHLTRINLSDQTDIIDLFGTDAPVLGENIGNFDWQTAPFLSAMENGHWVLLDEMNLAPQAVLEGLNACMDHRGEVYVPELNKSFKKHRDFRIFATQNPHASGGGRKGLPKSFINRFSVVYIDPLKTSDMEVILAKSFPSIPSSISKSLVQFASRLQQYIIDKPHIVGAPWEVNLRDLLRCHIILAEEQLSDIEAAVYLLMDPIFVQRFRANEDRQQIKSIFESFFKPQNHSLKPIITPTDMKISNNYFRRGLKFSMYEADELSLFRDTAPILESLCVAVQHRWPALLVGPSSSGKTSMIRSLASIMGTHVITMCLDATTDTVDLLGGYEQTDPQRLELEMIDQLKNVTNDSCNALLSRGCINKNLELLLNLQILLRDWKTQKNAIVELINSLQDFPDFDKFICFLERNLSTKRIPLSFQWLNGPLVKAALEGHWLILENSNLCAPSVLDRLNSLLEDQGTLVLHEHSDINGNPDIIKPHRNFRIFLTTNPKFGELSRSMRNRCVEIAFQVSSKSTQNVLAMNSVVHNYVPARCSKQWNTKQILSFICAPISQKYEEEIIAKVIPLYLSAFTFHSMAAFLRISDEFLRSCGLTSTALLRYVLSSSITEGYTDELERVISLVHERNMSNNLALFQSFSCFSDESITRFKQSDALEMEKLVVRLDCLITMACMQYKLSHSYTDASTDGLPCRRSGARKLLIDYITEDEDSPASLMVTILGAVPHILKELISELHTLTTDNLKLTSESISSINAVWQNIFDTLLTSHGINFSHLHVYQKKLRAWVTQIHPIINPVSENVSTISHCIRALSKRVSLTYGYAMQAIWMELKSLVLVRSDIHINIFQRFQTHIKLFDNAVKGNLDDIVSIASIRCSLLAFAFDSMFSALPERLDIDKHIEVLTKYKSHKPGSSQTIFSIAAHHLLIDILLHRATIDDCISDEQLPQELLQLAQGSTFDLFPAFVACKYKNERYVLKRSQFVSQTLSQLWFCASSEKERKSFLLRESRICALLRALSNYERVTINDWDYASKELKIYASSYFNNRNKTTNDPIVKISILLLKNIMTLTEILQKHLDVDYFDLLFHLSQFYKLLFRRDNCANYDIEPIISEIKKFRERSSVFTSFHHESFICSIEYLCQTFSYLASEVIHSSQTYQTLGCAWIYYSLAMIVLYVPNQPFDPAADEIVTFVTLSRETERLDACVSLERLLQHQFAWLKQTNTESRLTERFQIVQKSLSNCNTFPVFRTRDKNFLSLQMDLDFILNATVKNDILTKTIKCFETDDGKGAQYLENLSASLFTVQQKLSQNLIDMVDVTSHVVEIITDLRLGIDILLTEFLQRNKENTYLHSLSMSCFDLDFMLSYCDKPELTDFGIMLSQLLRSTSMDFINQLVSHLLKLTVYLVLPGTAEYRRNVLSSRWSILTWLCTQWKLNCELWKSSSEQNQSVYKNAETADEELERLLDTYFPQFNLDGTYQGVLAIQASPSRQKEEWLSFIYKIVQDFIVGTHQTSVTSKDLGESLKKLLHSGLLTYQHAIDFFPVETSFPLTFCYHGLVDTIALKQAHSIITDASGKSTDQSLILPDFYRDANTLEMRDLLRIVQKTNAKLEHNLQQWPDHGVLIDASMVCKRLLTLKLQTPLAHALIIAGSLYRILDEWNVLSNSSSSLSELHFELKNLILKWRSLELKYCLSLKSFEEQKIKEEACVWWFHLIDCSNELLSNCQAGFHTDQYNQNLVLTIDAMFRKINIGSYSFLLDIIKALYRHHRLCNNERGSALLYNIHQLYSIYLPGILKQMNDFAVKFEAELKEVIQLASWKDANVIALQETTRRSHRQLLKAARKYKLALSTGVQFSMPGMPLKAEQHLNIEFELDRVCQNSGEWEKYYALSTTHFPTYFSDASSITKKMADVVSRWGQFLSGDDFKSFASQVLIAASDLKNETPTYMTKENESAVKHLKTRKRKCFTDSLKTYAQMGFKLIVNKEVYAKYSDWSRILADLPLLEDDSAEYKGLISSINNATLRLICMTPYIMQDVSIFSPDLTRSEILKGRSGLLSLWSAIYKERLAIWQFLKVIDKIKESTAFGEILVEWTRSGCPVNEAPSFSEPKAMQYEDLILLLYKLKNILVVALELKENSISFQNSVDHSSEAEETIFRWLKTIEILLSESESHYKSSVKLLNFVQMKWVECVNEFFKSIKNDLKNLCTHQFEIQFVAHSINSMINQTRFGKCDVDNEEFFEHELIFEKLRGFAERFLIALQLLNSDAVQTGKAIDEQISFAIPHQSLLTVVMRLGDDNTIETMSESLHLFGNYITSNNVTIEHKTEAAKSFSHLYFILTQYYHCCNFIMSKILMFHHDIVTSACKLTSCFYTLAKTGFCTPPNADDCSTKDKCIAGPGLGDDEITEESNDVTEQLQGNMDIEDDTFSTNDENSATVEANTNAIETDTDLGNSLRDNPKEENITDDGKSGDESQMTGSQSDIEDQMDKLGDLDEVDEKFWADDSVTEDNITEQESGNDAQGKDPQSAINKDEKKNDTFAEKLKSLEEDGNTQLNSDVEDESIVPNDNEKQKLEELGVVIEPLDLSRCLSLSENGDLEEDECISMSSDIEDGSSADQTDLIAPPAENNAELLENSEDEQQSEPFLYNDIQPEQKLDTHDEHVTSNSEIDVDGAENDQPESNRKAEKTNKGKNNDDYSYGETENDSEVKTKRDQSLELTCEQKDETVASRNLSDPIALESTCELNQTNEVNSRQLRMLSEILDAWRRNHKPIMEFDPAVEVSQQHDITSESDLMYANNERQIGMNATGPAGDLENNPFLPEIEAAKQESMHADVTEINGDLDKTGPELTMSEFDMKTRDDDDRPDGDQFDRQQKIFEDVEVDKDVKFISKFYEVTSESKILSTEMAHNLWSSYARSTQMLANILCEQFRLILEPTMATRLSGGFRSGKRLDIKAIIPYIASDFKRDRIWMKRVRPSRREYQIMIALDDSRSMREGNLISFAFESLALVTQSLKQLEVGKVGIMSFGEQSTLVHSFDKPFLHEDGTKILKHFNFDQSKTDIKGLASALIHTFSQARYQASSTSRDLWQLCIIISDGICEDHASIKRLIKQAEERKIMLIFVILDAINTKRSESITEMKQVDYELDAEGNTVINITRYLETFPFRYFVFVRNIAELPLILSSALRQWFASDLRR